MGIYGERVLPRIINFACGLRAVEPLRPRVCEGLTGQVVEIGFGTRVGSLRGTGFSRPVPARRSQLPRWQDLRDARATVRAWMAEEGYLSQWPNQAT